LKIISIAGARPNFMKIAPIDKEIRRRNLPIQHLICHTGQHYDPQMSDIFFQELGLPAPHFCLNVGSDSQAKQTAKIMIGFEDIALRERPDLIIVVGDVNSTLACSLVGSKLGIPIAHVESGLRSFDRTMPEEINRKLTDALSDILFVSEPSGLENLKKEGFSHFYDLRIEKELEKIRNRVVNEPFVAYVGNIMIDSLVQNKSKIDQSGFLHRLGIDCSPYILVTFHRPQNVDNPILLKKIVEFLNRISANRKTVFPIHPRTRHNIHNYGLEKSLQDTILTLDPLGYIDFMKLVQSAELVITDSGGVQEETTYLGVQCITARDNTERPVTVSQGTNHLAGSDIDNVENVAMKILSGDRKKGKNPDLWDGRTAGRIIDILLTQK